MSCWLRSSDALPVCYFGWRLMGDSGTSFFLKFQLRLMRRNDDWLPVITAFYWELMCLMVGEQCATSTLSIGLAVPVSVPDQTQSAGWIGGYWF